MSAVNLYEKLATFSEHWSPRVVSSVNGHDVMVVKARGAFNWRSRTDTDALILVLKGRMTIKLPDRDVELSAGEMFVVPKGVQHCPIAHGEVELVIMEPAGTPNTGDPKTAASKPHI